VGTRVSRWEKISAARSSWADDIFWAAFEPVFFSLAQVNGPVSSDFFGRSPCSENLVFFIFFGDFSKINIAST
jgi:hypothetical protein